MTNWLMPVGTLKPNQSQAKELKVISHIIYREHWGAEEKEGRRTARMGQAYSKLKAKLREHRRANR